MRRSRTTAVVALAGLLMTAAPAAATTALDLDNPHLFGHGEGWARPEAVSPSDSGPWVIRLQQGLVDRGFRPGPIDGTFGKATLGAVYAFQKVYGLETDGIFHAEDWQALAAAERTIIPEVAEQPDRVEVDLEKQVLYLVIEHSVEAVLPISTGNGELYRGRGGSLVRARTPEGSFSFQRRINGWRISYLGGLYRPYYFRGGYAIHGSSNVPPFPDSHGCVRVEIHDMDYLYDQLRIGMPIHIYGEGVARSDLFEA